MQRELFWPVILIALACADSASAQDPATRPLVAPAGVFSSAFGLAEVDDRLIAGGPGYKALFTRAGFSFVPALGSAAPREFPLHFQLDSVWRGEQELFRADDPGSEPRLEHGHVRYEHGGGLAETYEARAKGVEQSFTWDEIPAGQGDLIVRGRISTELEAAGTDDPSEGLCFARPGLGGVRIGAVTGIDGSGARAAGWLRWDGQFLELGLPAEFVDAAVAPLVLDPLYGARFEIDGYYYSNSSNWGGDRHADVAYDSSTQTYLVVWVEESSAYTADIRGQRVSTSGGLLGSLIFIETGSAYAGRPTVANVNASNRFLVAWSRVTSLTQKAIDCRAVAASNGALSSVVLVTSDGESPELGGDSSTADNEALIVYSSQIGYDGIRARQVTVPSTGNPSPFPDIVAVSSNTYDHGQVISRQGGSSGQFLIGWERDTGPSSAQSDLYVRAYSRNLVPLSSELLLADSADEETGLAIDGDGSNFLALWEREVAPDQHDVWAGRIQYANGALTKSNVGALDSGVEVDEREADVAYAGSKYIAVWSQTPDPYSTYPVSYPEILVTTLDPATCMACEAFSSVGGIDDYDRWPAIASQLDGAAGESDRALLVWHTVKVFTNAEQFDGVGSVQGQIAEAKGTGGIQYPFAAACGAGGTISTNTSAAVGSPITFQLAGAPASATTAVLNIAPSSATLVSCGNCTVVSSIWTYTVSLAGGAASKAWVVPCSSKLLGSTVYAQWTVMPATTSPCASSPNVVYSNTLALTIGS